MRFVGDYDKLIEMRQTMNTGKKSYLYSKFVSKTQNENVDKRNSRRLEQVLSEYATRNQRSENNNFLSPNSDAPSNMNSKIM